MFGPNPNDKEAMAGDLQVVFKNFIMNGAYH